MMAETVGVHVADEAEYRAAHSVAVFVDRSADGRLWATGRDRIDLIHRMSTNDLQNMAEGDVRFTVLTDAIARIIDRVQVVHLGERALIRTGAGQGETVRKWLSSYVFFNDDARFADASGELGQLGVFGPRAAMVIEAVVPGIGEMPERRAQRMGNRIVIHADLLAGDGWTVIAPREEMSAVTESLAQAGAVGASQETYQVLRIEAGQGEAGIEISGEYNPLEAGLWDAVSFSKGCYIGQEIIARMESRGKLAKTLVGLRLSAPVAPGSDVRAGERKIGVVSSVAVSPSAGPIALGFAKPEFAAPGTVVMAGDVPAEVKEFPLS